MKSAPALFVVVLVGCTHPKAPPVVAPPVAQQTSITLPAPVPVAGPYVHFEKQQHEKLTVRGTAVEGFDTMTTDECVVAVEGGAIKELAVTFVAGHFTVKAGDPIGDHVADLAGRTFHETFANGMPQFTEHGAAVEDREVALALSGYQRGDVGRPYWLGEILYGRLFEVGKAVELADMRIGDTLSAKKLTVTLGELAKGRATFSLVGEFAPDSPLDKFESKVVVDTATARVLEQLNSLGTHGEVAQKFTWKVGTPGTCP